MSLRDRIATPDGKRRYVRSLFATIADRYDFITVALSYGQDRRWKRRLIELASIRAGHRVLDLATGTGDIAFAASDHGARVVGLDITHRLIQWARMKGQARWEGREGQVAQVGRVGQVGQVGQAGQVGKRPFIVGDMLAHPLPCTSLDIVTTGYGLRNVPDLTQ